MRLFGLKQLHWYILFIFYMDYEILPNFTKGVNKKYKYFVRILFTWKDFELF